MNCREKCIQILRVPYKNRAFKFLRYLASISALCQVEVFERLLTITELVISPFRQYHNNFWALNNFHLLEIAAVLELQRSLYYIVANTNVQLFK